MHYIANSSSKDADGMSNVVQTVNNLRVAASLEHIEWSSKMFFFLIQTSLSLLDSHLSSRLSVVSRQEAVKKYQSSLKYVPYHVAIFIRPWSYWNGAEP